MSDGPPEPWLIDLIASLGPQWTLYQTPYARFGADKEFGEGGSGARQMGHELASKDLLVWMDDDDVFTLDAFSSIRRRAIEHPNRPMIFRFMPNHDFDIYHSMTGQRAPDGLLAGSWLSDERKKLILWDAIGPGRICPTWITGQQFVTPNVKHMLSRCTDRKLHDYDFVRGTVDLYQGKESDVKWCPELIGLWNPAIDIPDTIKPFAPYVGFELKEVA
jgi:hypothetical protein